MLPYPLAQLDAFCTAHPLEPKVLLGPTVQAGDQLVAALGHRGRGCTHLHVATPYGWAERCVGPHLKADGWTRLAEGADLFVIRQAIHAVRSSGSSPAVEAWLKQQTPRTMRPVIRSLRGAGITPADIRAAPLAAAKQRGLVGLLKAYAEELEAAKHYDAALLFQRGIAEAPAPGVWVAILDGTPCSRMASLFIRALAGERLVRIGSCPSSPMEPPVDSAVHRWRDAPGAAEAGAVYPAAAIWTSGLTAKDRASVRLRMAPGTGAEVRGVLRDVLARGLPLDQVEIAYTADDPYLGQWCGTIDRFDVPATLATGRSALWTRTGQALRGFYQWLAQGGDSEQLAALCRARLCTFHRVLDDAPTPPAVAAVLDRGVHGLGIRRHRALIDQLQEQCRDDDSERAALDRVGCALDALTSLVPDDDLVSVEEMATAGTAFAMWFGPEAIDAAPVTSLVQRLRDVSEAVGRTHGPRAQMAGLLQRLIETHRVSASAARPGALHIAPLERAGYTGRPHGYVVGLDASSFPSRPAPDPVLSDTERTVLEGLSPQEARTGEAEWHLNRVLGAASKTVTLSARTGDVARGADVSPSGFFQRVADQLEYSIEAIDASVVPAFPLVPASDDIALDATERLLARRATPGVADAVQAEAPWLVDGLHAQHQRATPKWTRFDGLTGQAAPQHALGTGEIPTSASRLETLAACPYRYFMRHVLDVAPPDTPDEDPARWLTPRQFGALLHDLYHDFMAQAEGPVTDGDSHADTLANLLERKIEAYRTRIPVKHEAAFRADCNRLEQAARVFLAAEARRTEAEPVAFEVSFGQGRSISPHQAMPVPLALSDTVEVLLEGQIDRVDRLPDGDYAIWDYKTGSMRGYDAHDLGANGQRLQWALYAHAFEAMLQAADAAGTVQQSGYFFANARACGQRLADRPPPRDEIGAQLAPLLDLAAEGAFPHIHKRRGTCTFCDYHHVCASEAKMARDVQAMAEASPDDAVISAITRWMDGV
jgi:RecB family exonuclease